jgi:eukaryotic-like serine/threonine-protein kinase
MSQPSRTDLNAQSSTNMDAQSRADPDEQGTERMDGGSSSPSSASKDTSWETLPGQFKLPEAPPALGTFGDYELLQEIARGGMGVVYKARQRGLERTVAIKMILSGQHATGEDVERFCLEARSAANLDHPNIVPIYEIGQHQGRHYFSMAFIEGSSLTSLVRDKGVVMSFKESASIVQAVANGIQYAHDHGIVHRDLKPENVMIDKHGRPRVTDFGLAKRQQVDSGLTAAGQVMGTPSYMAPEQAMGKSTIGPAADIYSLGGILYFLLTSRPPFLGSNVMETLFQVVQQDLVPPRQVNQSVPAELEAICLKCLQKDPQKRFPSAGHLAAALGAWASHASSGNSATEPMQDGILATLAPNALPTGPATALLTAPANAGRIRSPWLWIGIGGGVLACAVVVAGLLIDWRTLLHGRTDERNNPDTNAGQETPRVIQADGFTKPKKLRREFGLKFDIHGIKPGPNGEFSVPEGTDVTFTLKLDRDAYVCIWSVNADGSVVTLFPNADEPNNLIRANKVYTIPGTDKHTISPEISKGLDHIWVVASTTVWDPPEGERQGPFTLFRSTEEKEKWQRQLRGLVLKPTTSADSGQQGKDGVSEEIIPYRVQSKKE